jgi:hypothetical protein
MATSNIALTPDQQRALLVASGVVSDPTNPAYANYTTLTSAQGDQAYGTPTFDLYGTTKNLFGQLGLDFGAMSGVKPIYSFGDPNALVTTDAQGNNDYSGLMSAAQKLGINPASFTSQVQADDGMGGTYTQNVVNYTSLEDAVKQAGLTGFQIVQDAPQLGDQNTRSMTTYSLQNGQLVPQGNTQTFQYVPQSNWTSTWRPFLEQAANVVLTTAAPVIAPAIGAAIAPEASAATQAAIGNTASRAAAGLISGQDPTQIATNALTGLATSQVSNALASQGVPAQVASPLVSAIVQQATTGSINPVTTALQVGAGTLNAMNSQQTPAPSGGLSDASGAIQYDPSQSTVQAPLTQLAAADTGTQTDVSAGTTGGIPPPPGELYNPSKGAGYAWDPESGQWVYRIIVSGYRIDVSGTNDQPSTSAESGSSAPTDFTSGLAPQQLTNQISSLWSIGQSASPPASGGTSIFGSGSGAFGSGPYGDFHLVAVDNGLGDFGAHMYDTGKGFTLLTYSDGHGALVNQNNGEVVWVDNSDVNQLLSNSNVTADPQIVVGGTSIQNANQALTDQQIQSPEQALNSQQSQSQSGAGTSGGSEATSGLPAGTQASSASATSGGGETGGLPSSAYSSGVPDINLGQQASQNVQPGTTGSSGTVGGLPAGTGSSTSPGSATTSAGGLSGAGSQGTGTVGTGSGGVGTGSGGTGTGTGTGTGAGTGSGTNGTGSGTNGTGSGTDGTLTGTNLQGTDLSGAPSGPDGTSSGTPSSPNTSPSQTSSGGGGGGGTSSTTSKLGFIPAAAQKAQSSVTPQLPDLVNQYLTTAKTGEKYAEDPLKQMFGGISPTSGLDPALASLLIEKGYTLPVFAEGSSVSAPTLSSTKTNDSYQEQPLNQMFNGISPASGLDPSLTSLLVEKGYTLPVFAEEGSVVAGAMNTPRKFIPAQQEQPMNQFFNAMKELGAQQKITPARPQVLQSSPTVHNPMAMPHLQQIRPGLSAMAQGGLPEPYRNAAPPGHRPEFITGLTGYYADGGGTGQSDDIPAMLHDGDYVMDAETVSALGDGSSKAGRKVLDEFRGRVPHRDVPQGEPVPAQIADGEYVFPSAFVTALGKGDNKRGAEILDGLRERLRKHKRAAPVDKIPPKAKSPLDYIRKS